MDLWIYNEDRELQGIVDTASSIIWANRFRQCGDFEIYISATPAALDLLREDRMVARQGSDMVGIIEAIELKPDEENGDFLIVTGRCLRSILGRRVVWTQTELSGTVEGGLRRLVTDAFISPTIAARKYDKLKLAAAHGYTDKLSAQYTGTNVGEAVDEICAAHDYGYRMAWLTDGTMSLDFYKATDRTAGQSENPRVIFSEEYDNLTSSVYKRDKKNYKTVALVAGEGEGTARRRTVVDRTGDTGLHRRELYVDARDVSSNDGEVSAAKYTELLNDRGDTSLSEATIVESMEGTVEELMQYTFGVDYFLGDKVTVINKYGIAADAQVLEVVEVWDESGYTCTPTFG